MKCWLQRNRSENGQIYLAIWVAKLTQTERTASYKDVFHIATSTCPHTHTLYFGGPTPGTSYPNSFYNFTESFQADAKIVPSVGP
jgi:hypothetical protein